MGRIRIWKQKRRAGGFAVALAATTLAAGLPAFTPAAAAQVASAEPSIALLNPSSFAAAGGRGIIVSDAEPDAGPGCCEQASELYRLSAWVGGAPEGATVFFLVTQNALEFEVTGHKHGSRNTWVGDWDMSPEMLDGPATIGAYLIRGEEVLASTETEVTIMRFQEAVRLTSPSVGGSFGTYAALATATPAEGRATRRAAGVVNALYTATAKMAFVRVFYTTSAPGERPQWKACGTESVSRAADGVRCSLQDVTEQSAISALAAVANDSPGLYNESFNQSGDAVPLGSPYAQVATGLSLSGALFEEVAVEPSSGRSLCSGNQTVTVSDQFGRPIAGANVDVHATGPSDGLRFHTFALLTVNQAPDRGPGHTTEPAFDCTGQTASTTSPNLNPDLQAEHQRFGHPDRKHIETRAEGTSDLGAFSFRLRSDSVGVTDYTAWLDEGDDGCLVNDDSFTAGEMSVTGSLGWGRQAGPPSPQPLEPLVACEPDADEPEPEPSSDAAEPEPPGARSIWLRSPVGATLLRIRAG